MTNTSQTIPPLVELVFKTGIATLYLSALVYVAGWSYADRFFAELGLNISAIDGLGTTSFSAYAFWVFRDGALSIAAGVVALLVVAFLARRNLGTSTASLVPAATAALALISLFAAGYLGAARATQQVDRLFSDDVHNTVRIIVHARPETELARYLAARPGLSEHGCLRKLFMDKKTLYGYAGYESQRGANQQLLIIPLAEVALIETLPIRDLCRL